MMMMKPEASLDESILRRRSVLPHKLTKTLAEKSGNLVAEPTVMVGDYRHATTWGVGTWTIITDKIDSSSAISLSCAILLCRAPLIRDGGAVKTIQMFTSRLLVKKHGIVYTDNSTIPPGCQDRRRHVLHF